MLGSVCLCVCLCVCVTMGNRYGVLKEAEHRSLTYIPYWNLPLADVVVPRQRQFKHDITVINKVLDELILKAQETRCEQNTEALQVR